MTTTIDAICENGTLRPLQADALTSWECQRVRVVIQPDDLPESLRLATAVYQGLSESDIDEVERLALDRPTFACG